MADLLLNNTASFSGTYNGGTAENTSLVTATQIVSGLTITKSADKQVWADRSNLTYIVNISNDADHPLSALTMTDQLDTAKISYVADSMTVDGSPVTPTNVDGLLTVALPDLDVGDSTEVVFQVQKV